MGQKFLLKFKISIYSLAMITWNAPSKQLQRGCMAWQDWNYEILITPHFDNNQFESEQEDGITLTNIKQTSYLFNKAIESLQKTIDTFSFSVRARSSSGTVSLS